jgi:hypothetical protein
MSNIALAAQHRTEPNSVCPLMLDAELSEPASTAGGAERLAATPA